MAMRWSRWVATGAAAAHPSAGRERSRSSPSISIGRRRPRDLPRRRRGDRIPSRAVHAVPAFASCPRQRRRRPPEWGIRRSSQAPGQAGTVDAGEAAVPHAQVRNRLAAFLALVQAFDRWRPSRSRVVIRPVRRGFIMTPSMITSEPGVIRAATSGNAADEGSAGTTTSAPRRSGWPWRVMRAAVLAVGFDLDAARRKWRSIRSVWSRVASRSITVVRPAQLRPARRMADLIWAEAAGVS